MVIIKINREENYIKYLELDDNLFNKNSEKGYNEESIYILHYPNSSISSVSFGYGIETVKDKEFDISHKCNTETGSSGGPILNLSTNKVIGIHKAFINRKKFNIGTLLKYPINLLKEKNTNSIQKFKIKSFGEEIIPNFSQTCNFDLINKQISSICYVKGFYKGDDMFGTGFFCKIPYKNEKIPVLITCYYIVDDEFFEKNKELKIYRNFKEYNIKIDKNNKIYSSPDDSKHYDIMIIKLNEEDNINEYLELDEKIFNNDSEIFNKTKYVYMLSFSLNEKPKISFGDLLRKEERNFNIA